MKEKKTGDQSARWGNAKKITRFLSRLLPRSRSLRLFFAIGLGLLLLLPAFRLFPAFAEWFARFPAARVRTALGGLSSLFPFSLFEILIGAGCLYLLFLLAAIPVCLIRKKQQKAQRLGAYLLVVPIVLLTVADLFTLSFASSYYRYDTARHLGLATEKVGEEEVFYALEALVETVNRTAPALTKNQEGESVGLPLKEVKALVNKACDAYGDRNGFYQKNGYEAKAFLSSPLMTYTHISGIFGFFTGEANVNTNYPHFIVTATLAHESSHARGIGPENECNFLASVILMESENPYLVYCGAIFVLDDFIATAKKLDRERCLQILQDLDETYSRDMAAYSEFFEPYRDSTASKVANTANDSYLKSMGQKEGIVSYSRVIRLVSAYYQEKNA